jgi:hypothetical protein
MARKTPAPRSMVPLGGVSGALGMGQLVTYTLPEESGASLRGAGWVEDGQTAGGEWTRSSRPRAAAHDARSKTRWIA